MSNYDALVLSLEKRFSAGLTFLAGFSWQKTLDLASSTAFEGNLGAYPYGSIMRDYGVSDFNRKRGSPARSTTSFPDRRPERLRYALGGWQINGILVCRRARR